MSRPEFRFSYSVRVRFNETDPHGIVYYANYNIYTDCGMREYLRTIGVLDALEHSGEPAEFRLVTQKFEYLRSAHFDELLDVCIRSAAIGKTSITYAFEIYKADECVTSGTQVWVHFSSATGKPAPLPPDLTQKLQAFEHGRVR